MRLHTKRRCLPTVGCQLLALANRVRVHKVNLLRWKVAAALKIKAVVHEAEEGGFWAEVPALPGCATQGDTMDELIANLREAIEGCLTPDIPAPDAGSGERVLEIAI